jgi:hypothetical protein
VRPAPPFDCAGCGRRIGKTRTHYRLDGSRQVVCSRCLTKTVHARLFPDCPHRWHDTLDHSGSCGTRAGVAHVLGLWP